MIQQGVKCKVFGVGFALLFSVTFALSASDARAAEVGLGVTASLFDLAILPGDSYQGKLTVYNTSETTPIPVHIQLSLWDLKEDSDDIEFIIAEAALNATKWFTLQTGADFILEPDGDKNIEFQIEAPQDAAPGSYLVMMRFQAVLPEHYFVEEGPRFLPELGVLFFIKIPVFGLVGDEQLYKAEILSFEPKGVKGPGLLENILPYAEAGVFDEVVEKFVAKIENQGIYHFKASGSVEIQNVLGTTIASSQLPERYFLPNRTRDLEIEVLGEKSFFQRLFRAGPYTAIVVLNVPGSDIPIIEQISFWAFPWKTFLGILFIVVALIILRRRIWTAIRVLATSK